MCQRIALEALLCLRRHPRKHPCLPTERFALEPMQRVCWRPDRGVVQHQCTVEAGRDIVVDTIEMQLVEANRVSASFARQQ